MKTMWLALVAAVALVWSASWVSACDGCGCKDKAKGETVKAATTEAPAKCVACPKAQAAGKEAVKCPGTCKEGCCKGDPAKCATCKACPAAKAAKTKAGGTAAKACTAGEAKAACGAAAETKACGAAAGETKACGAATAQ